MELTWNNIGAILTVNFIDREYIIKREKGDNCASDQ